MLVLGSIAWFNQVLTRNNYKANQCAFWFDHIPPTVHAKDELFYSAWVYTHWFRRWHSLLGQISLGKISLLFSLFLFVAYILNLCLHFSFDPNQKSQITDQKHQIHSIKQIFLSDEQSITSTDLQKYRQNTMNMPKI